MRDIALPLNVDVSLIADLKNEQNRYTVANILRVRTYKYIKQSKCNIYLLKILKNLIYISLDIKKKKKKRGRRIL